MLLTGDEVVSGDVIMLKREERWCPYTVIAVDHIKCPVNVSRMVLLLSKDRIVYEHALIRNAHVYEVIRCC